jgi:putative pyruvate formate lyase activating enzyme
MDLSGRCLPLYTHLSEERWREKFSFFQVAYGSCTLCPRGCGARRDQDEAGVCQAVKSVKIASFNLHHGEEPPVSGSRGSGTLFFSGCTLKCLFCQNYPISHLFNGIFYSIEELAGLMLNLQERGAHNINLVSPTPYLYHFVRGLYLARGKGLTIPIAYNTSGYERTGVIAMLEGVVDVYMPDLKYIDGSTAQKYSGVSNYFEQAFPAILEMYRQVGGLETDEKGIANKGMLVRHLILPGEVENSKRVLETIARSPFADCHLSLMSQYFPAHKAPEVPGIGGRLKAPIKIGRR